MKVKDWRALNCQEFSGINTKNLKFRTFRKSGVLMESSLEGVQRET